MTKPKLEHWVVSDELDSELSSVLASARADEPAPERVRTFEQRMATLMLPSPTQSSSTPIESIVTSSAKKLVLAKLAAGTLALTLGTATLWVAISPRTRSVELPVSSAVTPPTPQALAPQPAIVEVPESPRTRVQDLVQPAATEVRLKGRRSHIRRQLKPAASSVSNDEPQLAREVAMLQRMQAHVADDPCLVLTLAGEHKLRFSSALLGEERDHYARLARLELGGARCPERTAP